jgi:type VI protein secretion system component VasF
MAAVSVVYTLYDALVSINVPDDKAKAVIDAMERDLFAQVVTRTEFTAEMKLLRQEISTMQQLLSRDIQALDTQLRGLRDSTSKDIESIRNSTGKDAESLKSSVVAFRSDVGTQLQSFKDSIGPQIKAELEGVEHRMTVRLGKMMAGIVAIATALLGAVEYFH